MSRVMTFVVAVVVLVLACSVVVAGPQDFNWQLRGGLHSAGSSHPALGLDYTNVDNHPNAVINYASADWLDFDSPEGWLVGVGHRWTDSRAGLNLSAGPWFGDGTTRLFASKVSADYAVSDQLAVSVGYFKNGIHSASPHGHGFLLQVAHRF